MKITLTSCWLPGQDPRTAPPFLTLRSDTLMNRTVPAGELERFNEEFHPEWKSVRVADAGPRAPVVMSAAIETGGGAVCRSCDREAEENFENAPEIAAHWDI